MGRPLGSKNKISRMITTKCLYCGKKFKVYPYRKDTVKFCSYRCAGLDRIGKEFSEEHRQKLSEIRKKNPPKFQFKKGHTPWNKGTKGIMKPWNKGLDGYKAGKEHYNWQGGKSFEPYGIIFNKKLKENIRKRDNYTCQECGYMEKQLGYKLHCHHIDYNKLNNKLNNLISLCRNCHMQTNFKRRDWIKYFSNKLINL